MRDEAALLDPKLETSCESNGHEIKFISKTEPPNGCQTIYSVKKPLCPAWEPSTQPLNQAVVLELTKLI